MHPAAAGLELPSVIAAGYMVAGFRTSHNSAGMPRCGQLSRIANTQPIRAPPQHQRECPAAYRRGQLVAAAAGRSAAQGTSRRGRVPAWPWGPGSVRRFRWSLRTAFGTHHSIPDDPNANPAAARAAKPRLTLAGLPEEQSRSCAGRRPSARSGRSGARVPGSPCRRGCRWRSSRRRSRA